MNVSRFLRVLFPALCVTAVLAQPVTINSGKLTGKDAGEVQFWLGIPYAAPPVGDLRWRSPQPPKSWDGVRTADHYGAVCIQPASFAGGQTTSEDCLFLNVWAPKSGEKHPVMFWIHGGAFIEGSGSSTLYNGAELARQGVVVVTFNYRLGDFGFFAHPLLTKESSAGEPATNFGFQDQIAALRWVKENVAAFGGDPANVTIFGESAGGSSVNYMMISPVARGLFHKAIAESGGAQAHAPRLAEFEKESETRAAAWGVTDLKSLRAVPAEKILSSPRRMSLGGLGLVVDGKYVTEDIPDAFAAGHQAPVPFLLGANSFEASLMTAFGITAESMLARASAGRERLREFYSEDPQKQAQGLFTDSVFLAPARFLASQMEKVKQPAYLYFFSYVAERRRAQVPGVQHGGEIPFVFGTFPAALTSLLSADDRKMAATVSAAWVQFAKTGSPNGKGLPEWPVYTASTDRLLEWGSPIALREHFRSQQLNLITMLIRMPR